MCINLLIKMQRYAAETLELKSAEVFKNDFFQN